MKPDEDDDIDPSLTGEDFVEAVKAKQEAKMNAPQMPQAAEIPNPAIAQVKKSPARIEIERIEEEKQAARDAEELKRVQFYNQLEKDHPTLVKLGRGIKKIAGVASNKIDSASGRFIQDQDAADRVMRKSSIPKPAKKKKQVDDEEEEYEDDQPQMGGMGGRNKKFPFRDFDSDSSLPKAAYLPKNQFGKEYKSVGVPVTLRMTGAQSGGRPSGGMPGMPEMPMGKKGKKGDKGMPMLDDHMRGGMGGQPQPSDNSGMGEYRSPRVPVTLGGGVAMGQFRGVGVPNSLSGVTIGGLGKPATPKIVMPVITNQNITVPNTFPLKKKGK